MCVCVCVCVRKLVVACLGFSARNVACWNTLMISLCQLWYGGLRGAVGLALFMILTFDDKIGKEYGLTLMVCHCTALCS